MKITTKRGDTGKTQIFGGKRIPKYDLRIEAEGALDEAISFLGFAKTKVKNSHTKKVIRSIQKDLFRIIAEIAREKKDVLKFERRIKEHDVKQLENIGDIIEKKTEIPPCFAIPGVNEESASLHIARTLVRRAERVIAALNRKKEINPQILAYLNRLSDLLYVLARQEEGKPDLLKY